MSLSTDIKFNKDLIINDTCTITYSGFLFKNNSEHVSIVFGFDDKWNNTTEQEMNKTETGFQADIKVLDFHNLNFCFRNSNYEWDNNNNKNYSAPISKPEENFIINENIIGNILNILLETQIPSKVYNTVPQEEKIQDFSDNTLVETNTSVQNITDTIFEPAIKTDNSTNILDTSFEATVQNTTPINIEESIGDVVEENSLDQTIESLFNDIYEESDNSETSTPEDTTQNNVETFNMDSLIDEILNPIIDSNSIEETNDTYEYIAPIATTIEQEQTQEEFSDNQIDEFEAIEDEKLNQKIDDLIDNLISGLYESQNITPEDFSKESETTTNTLDDIFSDDITQDLDTDEKNTLSIFEENNIDEKEFDSFENIAMDFDEKQQEKSLLEELKETQNTDSSKALVAVDSIDNYIVSARTLSSFYKFKKRIRLAYYKLIKLPRNVLSKLLGLSNN